VLHAIVKQKSADEVMKAFRDDSDEAAFVDGGTEKKVTRSSDMGLKELVDALIPYTERHLLRMDKLIQDSYMVDYILGEMDDGIFDIEDDAMDVDAVVDIKK
jgi:U3 small nucleolar RNA-associated protein 13